MSVRATVGADIDMDLDVVRGVESFAPSESRSKDRLWLGRLTRSVESRRGNSYAFSWL